MDILLKEYGRIIWKRKWAFLLIMLAVTSATVLDTSVPLYYKAIANGLAKEYSDDTLQLLMLNFSYMIITYAAIWLSWRALEFGMIPLEGGGIKDLEIRCFSVFMKQKHKFFEDSFSGSLIKQAGRFITAYERIMDWIIFQLMQNLLAITVAFVIFYIEQPKFALYFLIWVVIFITWSVSFSIWKLKYDKEVAEWGSKVGAIYSDAISNISVVKSFALEGSEKKRTSETSHIAYKKRRFAWILMFFSFAIQGLLAMGIELLLIYLMIQEWKQGSFNVGKYVLFQSILMLLIHRLWDFGRNFRMFFTAIADAAEMADIFREVDVEADGRAAQQRTIQKGEISFNNLSFSYGDNHLFHNFSLDIKAGEHIALVGQSGSGKTSLVKLLFRFTEPQSGKIRFDGIAADDFTLSSLRSQISLVPQQPELFHRSIRDNITLGINISDETLFDIAKKAQCLDFIEKLPEKFETLVGERGVKLSGGEKQRIAIARAFLDNAPIIVLDEATSALDSLTEQKIQAAIFELIKNKTAIVIAHRLSTILQMDRIVVLEQGKILEEGRHDALIENSGKYAEMWEHQSGQVLP